MNRRAALALALASTLAASAGVARGAPVRLVDDAGHALAQPAPARRIVTLAPHLTELAFAAGAGDAVVAVGRFSDFPAAARTRPVVGDAFAVDLEALAQLKPDLVLVWHGGTPQRTVDRLRTLGWPVAEIDIHDVPGIAAALRRIGRLAGTEAAADARADALAGDWAALRAAWAGRAPVRVFYQVWDAPLMTYGGPHLVSGAIAACGGRNVFGDLALATATVGWEAAVARDPQLVVSAGPPRQAAVPGRWSAFPQVSATRHGQFARVDDDLVSRPGPRFIDGVRQLCAAIDAARTGRPQPTGPASAAAR